MCRPIRRSSNVLCPKLVIAALVALSAAFATPASAMIATSVIRDVIRAAMPHYRACAGDQPIASPGTITVSFLVGPDGTVHEAEAMRDELGRPALTACVIETTLDLRFPPNERVAGIRVNYPFRFE